MRKLSKSAQKKAAQISAAVSAGFLSASVNAASLLPVGALTGVETDVLDTASAVTTGLLPMAIKLVISLAVIGMVVRAMRKSGVK